VKTTDIFLGAIVAILAANLVANIAAYRSQDRAADSIESLERLQRIESLNEELRQELSYSK
jgi:hypothetical protein